MNTARIIAYTMPTVKLERDNGDGSFTLMGVDEFIAYVARVSNPSNQMNIETAPKLLRYLAKHKHWSPFEMVNIVMEIETTRDIARQILRHRSFSFQEFSQRYADPTQDLGFVTREARLQDQKNRQNSIETDDDELQKTWNEWQDGVMEEAKIAYEWAIRNGIAKEQARAVLPEGLTVSRMYMNGTLRSYWHFISVRHHPAAQKEIRLIAASMSEQLIKLFPSLQDLMEEMIEDNYKGESNH
jgi:thymidylate synthase (FAD)